MAIKDKIIQAMPKEREFRAIDIADEIYPQLVRIDSEGRFFNRGCGTIARLLRTIDGVQESSHGVFFAHKEYFLTECCESAGIG